MNRSMFKSINRAQDLENRILLARSIAEERGTPVDSILAIQGVELPNCKYLMSTQKDGFILNNYFEIELHHNFPFSRVSLCTCRLRPYTGYYHG